MAVTPANIATALGVVTPDSGGLVYAQWEMWIADAEMLINDRRVELGFEPIESAKIDYVVRESVVAHVRKPDDATTVTIAVDDGSSTRRYESGKGRVSVDDWWDYLGLGETTDGAFSIIPAGNQVTSDPLSW